MENKSKSKKDFQALGSRLKSEKLSFESGPLYNKCFPRSMYSSQYEEECPVNYSLKYSETETCKTNKTANIKLKSKDLADSDYTETDLDQPTDFSLKYGEKMSKEDMSKNSSYEFYQNERRKFKSYTDYAETDLDQPTDFTLKYGELSDEEIKTVDFDYFKENKQKTPGSVENQIQTKELTNEAVDRHFMFEDQTPLMFSRSSSLNSLSSFEQNIHSIPDDRSSVVSDFSRTTSGLISPSELPDSPGQTEPSSPKRIKSTYFPTSRGIQKKSVFEDDVATYKQEDTPVEFSRTTSLSSLNIENPVKQEFNLKTNSTASSIVEGDYSKAKEENLNCASEKSLKEEILTEEPQSIQETQKLLISEDEDLLVSHIRKMTIQEKSFNKDLQDPQNSQNYLHDKKNCLKAFLNVAKEGNASTTLRYSMKSDINSIFNNTSEKVYPTFEGSDDDVHTYHTEGTPANVSHAGSHSDLSSLSLITGVVPSETEDNSEEGSCVFEVEDQIAPKCKKLDLFTDSFKEKTLCNKTTNSLPSRITNKNIPSENQTRNTRTNSSKANLKVIKQSNLIYLNCKEPQQITNGKNSKVYMSNGSCKNDLKSQTSSSNSELPISLNIENWLTESCTPLEEALVEQCIRLGRPHKNNRKKIEETDFKTYETREIQNWNTKSCTPLEEALVEQCIRLGMPQKTNVKKLGQVFKQNAEHQPIISPKFLNQGIAYNCPKTTQGPLGSAAAAQSLINVRGEPNRKTRSSNFLNFENWAMESCTPLQEALVEQCIRLGQPNKNNIRALEKNNSKGMEVNEENHKMIPKKHSGQLKLNSNGEKSNELPKKSERFICYSGRRLVKRRKKSKETCRRCKKHKEKQKNERSKF